MPDNTLTLLTLSGEFGRIVLVQASHVALVAGEDAAAAYAGFHCADGHLGYPTEPVERLELSRFPIWPTLKHALAEYRFPSLWHPLSEAEIQDLQAFMHGVPQYDSQGNTCTFHAPDALCRTLADTALARHELEAKLDLTVRQVALLADMSEASVRNVIAAGELSCAVLTPRRRVRIPNRVARSWLKDRRGWRPRPTSLADDLALRDDIESADLERLHWIIETLTRSVPAAAEQVWKVEDVLNDPTQARDFCAALGLSPALIADRIAVLSSSASS
jgi:hypothetical protein